MVHPDAFLDNRRSGMRARSLIGIAVRVCGLCWVSTGLAYSPARTIARPLDIADLVTSRQPQIATIVAYLNASGFKQPGDQTPLTPLFADSKGLANKEHHLAGLPIPGHEVPIIGGHISPDKPFVALVRKDKQPHCTGTIIGKHTVLTAAHCIATTDAQHQFDIGTLGLSTDVGAFAISGVLPHPQYSLQANPFVVKNDIGLIFTSEDLSTHSSLGQASLQTAVLTSNDCSRRATFVGYGATSMSDQSGPAGAGTRMEVDLYFTCTNDGLTYGSADQGTCYGDSGGPALLPAAGGGSRVIGVTSFYVSRLCDGSDTDTRVDAYATSWIKPNVQ